MLKTAINPTFSDTDALGHINHTVFPVWFEQARMEVFRIFHPSLDRDSWPLILAKMEVDYLAQANWEHAIIIKTFIDKIGSSSCTVLHEAWQEDRQVATGRVVLVQFDYRLDKSMAISEGIRQQLQQHLKKAL